MRLKYIFNLFELKSCNFHTYFHMETSKQAIVGRARLRIPISALCQLNKTIILFGSIFGNKAKVNF